MAKGGYLETYPSDPLPLIFIEGKGELVREGASPPP